MTSPSAPPESLAAPESAREAERRSVASGWWTTVRVTIGLVGLFAAGAFVALWIYGQTRWQMVSVRLPGVTLLVSSYQGRLFVSVLSGNGGNASFGKVWQSGFPIRHREFDPPAMSDGLTSMPAWSADWSRGRTGSAASMQCPCWFAAGLSGALALGAFPWRRFRRRSRTV